MVRTATLLLALTGSFVTLGAPALAQPGSFYGVTLAEPAAPRTIVRGMMFSCDGAACSAAAGTSRPAIVCASVVRELGPVTAFRAGDMVLDGEALAKCNAKADTTRLARR